MATRYPAATNEVLQRAHDGWLFIIRVGEESALSRDFIGQTRPIREAGGTGRFRVQVRACTGTLAAGFILSSGHFDYLIWRAIAMLALSAVAALFAASQVDQLERSR